MTVGLTSATQNSPGNCVLRRLKKRWQLTFGVVVALVFFAATLYRKHTPLQIITLPSGEQYEFVTAEWGTGHVQPTFLARTVAHLPRPITDFVVKKWGSQLGIVTIYPSSSAPSIGIPTRPPEPVLRFWFRCIQEKPGSMQSDFKFILADKDGVISGQGNGGWSACGQGKNKWLTFGFPVMPRRDDTLQLYLFHADDYFRGPFRQIATVQVPNPLFDKYPNWKPETVPATKMAGDLRVTLSNLTVGTMNQWGNIMSVDGKQTRFRPSAPGDNRTSVFNLNIDSPRGTNEGWLIGAAELSDATGNKIHSEHFNHWEITDEYAMESALWPDEPAWRLVLKLQKYLGYDPDEIITFTNLPVPSVGSPYTVFRTNSIHGFPVVLKLEFTRQPDRDELLPATLDWTHITAELLNHPKDFDVNFLELIGDTGWKPNGYSMRRGPDSFIVYLSSMPANVLAVNLKWAVQQQRTVEFLVKPPSAK